MEELNRYSINDLIADIKAKVLERSSNGIRGLALIFKEMDENGNQKLDVDDFRWGLKNFGISITKEESTQILQSFDKNGDGQVDFNEFMRAIRVSS